LNPGYTLGMIDSEESLTLPKVNDTTHDNIVMCEQFVKCIIV